MPVIRKPDVTPWRTDCSRTRDRLRELLRRGSETPRTPSTANDTQEGAKKEDTEHE